MNRLRNSILALATSAVMVPVLQGCFTGVESTPKITQRDIRKRQIVETAEGRYLADIRPQQPSEWKEGKRFLVTDDRISLVLNHLNQAAEECRNALAGTELTYRGMEWVNSLTGGEEAQMQFEGPGGSLFSYRSGISRDDYAERERLILPFTVDIDLIDEASSRLVGKEFYILQSRRLDSLGNETTGLRYQSVKIRAVTPGSDTQPLQVAFADESGSTRYVMMTLGSDATSTRNFETLFAFENPRHKYSNITNEVWDLVVHSQIQQGMTPAECRLALGAPNDYLRLPSTAGMVERWVYDDGVYLIFEDGHLSQFRK